MATRKTAAKTADPLAKDPAVSTTDSAPDEAKAGAGAPENKAAEFTPGSRESVAHHSVPMSKAYGAASKQEHRRSGYLLPDSFYEEEISEENAQHKVPGNQHGAK